MEEGFTILSFLKKLGVQESTIRCWLKQMADPLVASSCLQWHFLGDVA